jgi:hypothetical protein
MAEYSRIAKGHFTSVGGALPINLPFQLDHLKWWNYTLANTNATSQNMISGYWDVSMGQGQSIVQGYNATPTLIYDVVATGGISTFSAGQLLQYGPVYQHTGSTDFSITAASPAVVTTTTNHGLVSGNVIVFSNLYQSSTTGMQQMAGVPLTVTVTGATTFSVNWNASGGNYTAFNTATNTGNIGSWKQVLYPYLYAPEQAIITAINTSTNVVTTAAAHNFQIGQQVAFRIPSAWGTTQLNSLPDVLIPGSPIYWYVIAVTQNTFTVSQNSNGVVGFTGFTAFNPNQPFASFAGLKMPQVVPVGDINTGGQQISLGSQLYPPTNFYNGNSTTAVPNIGGPGILGAFTNNTSQGFVFGGGAGRVLTTGNMAGVAGNIIYYEATLSDLSVN